MPKLTNDLADASGSVARLVAVILRAVHKPVHKRYHNNAAIIFLILDQNSAKFASCHSGGISKLDFSIYQTGFKNVRPTTSFKLSSYPKHTSWYVVVLCFQFAPFIRTT